MADSLGEAFFLFLGEFLILRETLPRQAQIASWQARISQTAPAFSPLPGCLGMGKGYFEKAVRGFRETRHDRLGTEKIVVSGTDGSVRRQQTAF